MKSRSLLLGLFLLTPFLWSCQSKDEVSYKGKRAFFLIGEHEYGTPESLPAFAKSHLEPLGIESSFVFAAGNDRNSPLCHSFDGIAALETADILVLSTRRRFPTIEDMVIIRNFIDSGKPVIGLRTASHAFGEREKGEGYQAPEGHASWNTIDVDMLGAKYTGHYKEKEGSPLQVSAWIEESATNHSIVKNLSFKGPIDIGNKLYTYIERDPATNVLLSAKWDENEEAHPVAWINEKGGKRIFYMSPGSLDEMATPEIKSLLKAAVLWGLDGVGD
ncbi:MAG: ThuA domain-containing protein [Verrucomicrobia bacterium]|nr:ThuA domain-containing protein [Verrucomicrobiota bacterium]MDA1069576.1 ThuA domain-containing protein [Verrucomicrobiota bacterium]